MKKLLSSAVIACGLFGAATAEAAVITSYDIFNSPASGFGGWTHTYDGVISGSTQMRYTGGSGTLNDGVIGTSPSSTHLFLSSYAPVITLHLDGLYTINSLTIHGGNFLGNGIPGMMSGVTVTIGSESRAIATTPTGQTNGVRYADDFADFAAAGLLAIATDTIVLSNFVPGYSSYFSITEITLDATPGSAPQSESVPEPMTLSLLGLGLLGLAARRRKEVA